MKENGENMKESKALEVNNDPNEIIDKSAGDDTSAEASTEQKTEDAEGKNANVEANDFEEDKKKTSQADLLIELALAQTKSMFIDQYRTPYIQVNCSDHLETLPIDGPDFKLFLLGLFFESVGEACSPSAMRKALRTLAAMAQFAGDGMRTLNNRMAFTDGTIYYDLADPLWRAVKIDNEGWSTTEESPSIFYRFRNQSPQVMPSKKGDLSLIKRFLPINNPKDILLILIWIVAAFIPGFPHPVLNIFGPQGSAKTTICKMLKMLIDPSIKLTDALPRYQDDLIKRLNNSWLTIFDNMGRFSDWASDTICRGVTGDGYSERKLRTNNEEVLYSYQRVVVLNGINASANQPDIRDRSIFVKAIRIQPQERKTEKQLLDDFKVLRPVILAGIFDTVSKALAIYPKAKEILKGSLPRMADFCTWGYAITVAMDLNGKDFLDAYDENISIQNLEMVFENPVAHYLVKFMEKKNVWEGSSNALLDGIEKVASDKDKTSGDWPKEGRALTRKLNVLQTNLQEFGILIETGIHRSKGNSIHVQNLLYEAGKKQARANKKTNPNANAQEVEITIPVSSDDSRVSSHQESSSGAGPQQREESEDNLSTTEVPTIAEAMKD